MDIKASAKHIRISPRKVRMVVDLLRGLDVEKAFEQLLHINKAATRPVQKLLDSAIANAYHNFEIEKDNLVIKEIKVDEGPTQKRWKPRAFGRATPIRKRTSHISIILAEKVPGKKKATDKKKKKEALAEVAPKTVKGDVPPTPVSRDMRKPSEEDETAELFDARRKGKHRDTQHFDKKDMKQKGFLKKIFKRKSST